jgi:hypothetical protein
MKENTREGHWIGAYGVDTPQKSIPLQTADIFAWELTKEFETLVNEPNRQMRLSIKELLRCGGDKPLVRLHDRLGLLRLAKNTGCPDQTGVEEVDEDSLEQIFRRHAAQEILYVRRGLQGSTLYQPDWMGKAMDEKWGKL